MREKARRLPTFVWAHPKKALDKMHGAAPVVRFCVFIIGMSIV